MGSFNEVCALSGLNISPGTKVRQLFLTQNPYVKSDGHEVHRGCYNHDWWFPRTPPIPGVYDDYGKIAFQEGPLTELICKLFEKDVVERPFGFNQYHEGDVTKTKGIDHFLNAAWQGRLLVRDEHKRQPEAVPEHFPTWQKLHAIFTEAGLPLQLESNQEEGRAGYNAAPVIPGVVVVTYNSYQEEEEKLKKVRRRLSRKYDCSLVYMFDDRKNDPCLIVAPKGSHKNPALVSNDAKVVEILKTHPKRVSMARYRELPVLSVMIREDVWQTFCNLDYVDRWRDNDTGPKVKGIFDAIKKQYASYKKLDALLGKDVDDLDMFRSVSYSMPFQTVPSTHITAIDKDCPATEEIMQSVAELCYIEYIMAILHQPWYIPPLGGQDGAWDARTKLLTNLLAISQGELAQEKAQDEEFDSHREVKKKRKKKS